MSRPVAFFWKLVRRSFHGTFRLLEIGEAIVALVVHVLGYCYPAWKESLEVLFVYLVALLILTFFLGLLWSAYGLNQEYEKEKVALLDQFQKEKTAILDEFEKERTRLQTEITELKARLKPSDFMIQRTEAVKEILATLSNEHLAAVRQLRIGPMPYHQITERLRKMGLGPVDLDRLKNDTGLVERDVGNNIWRINPEYKDILEHLL